MEMSAFTSYVAEGIGAVEGAALGTGEVDQGILDSGHGVTFLVPDIGDTVFTDRGGGMDPIGDRIGDRIGEAIIRILIGEAILRIPIMEVMGTLVMEP